MKQQILLITAFLTLFYKASAQELPPKPDRLVNDYTNTLSPSEVSQLESKLVAFDDSTSTQIAVVLMRSVGSYEISDYASRLAESWGIGGAKNNNGVLLLAAIEDRKVTIQTGYGVEGALPDAIAKRIIENEIKPEFRQGNYSLGLERATDAIIAYTKGEYKNDQPPRQGRKSMGFPLGLIIIIIVIIIIIGRKGGGGGGRGGRVIGSRGGADIFWWTMLAGMGQGGRSGGGGFGGGSGGFGGGGGGGGFGGFGGGSFGGGGASGSW